MSLVEVVLKAMEKFWSTSSQDTPMRWHLTQDAASGANRAALTRRDPSDFLPRPAATAPPLLCVFEYSSVFSIYSQNALHTDSECSVVGVST